MTQLSKQLPPVVIGFLCILGVGMAAATLDTAHQYGSSGGSSLIQPPDQTQQYSQGAKQAGTGAGGTGSARHSSSVKISTCNRFVASTPGTLLVVLGFLLIVGLIYYRFNGSTALLAGWTIVPPIALVYFLVTNCASGSSGAGSGGVASIVNANQTPLTSVNVPPWMLGGVIGIVLVGAVVVLYRSIGGDEVVTFEADEPDEPELDRFAAAAGRAADRIEEHNADVDNAVYRAWVEMVGLLDVERPETYSSGEFAEEAIGLGMGRDDVEALTQLFNEVRYGGMDAEARGEEAISILRNIESQYSTPDVETRTNGTGGDFSEGGSTT